MKKNDIPILFKWKDLIGLSILCLGLFLAMASSEQKKQMKQALIANQNDLGVPFLQNLPPESFPASKQNFVTKAVEQPRPFTIQLKTDRLIKVTQVKR